MWDNINFPKTPENDNLLVIYFYQGNYFKLTKSGSAIMQYLWDGTSKTFNDVKIFRECH